MTAPGMQDLGAPRSPQSGAVPCSWQPHSPQTCSAVSASGTPRPLPLSPVERKPSRAVEGQGRAHSLHCTRPPPLSPPPPRAFMAQGSPAPWEWAAKPQRVLWGLSCPKPRWEQEAGVLLPAPSPCLVKQRGASPPTGAVRPPERQQEDAVLPETGNFTSCFCSSYSSGPRDPGLGEAQRPHRHGMWRR